MTQPTEATATRTATRKRSVRSFHAVDSHTEGMPTRVVTDGVGTLPGSTMAERRQWFIENADAPSAAPCVAYATPAASALGPPFA